MPGGRRELLVRRGSIGLEPDDGAAAAAGPMGLERAEQAGLIDLIDARPSASASVTDDDLPVTLSVGSPTGRSPTRRWPTRWRGRR